MGIFSKNYFDIGRNKSADDFLKTYRKVISGRKTEEREEALLNGAIAAFRENRPENIQTALLNQQTLNRGYYNSLVPSILLKVTENSSNKLADIDLALAKVPEQDKKDILRKALIGAIHYHASNEAFLSLMLETASGTFANEPEQERKNFLTGALNAAIESHASEAFCSLLLEQGADANSKVNGRTGSQLITAAYNNAPEAIAKLLYDNGASFKDAIATMVYGGNHPTYIERLRFYQEQIVGSPAAAEAGGEDLRQTLGELKEQVRGLTQVVGALTEEFRRHKDCVPAEAPQKPAPARRPYPSAGI